MEQAESSPASILYVGPESNDDGQQPPLEWIVSATHAPAVQRQRTTVRQKLSRLRSQLPDNKLIGEFAEQVETTMGDLALILKNEYPELFLELKQLLDASNPVNPHTIEAQTLRQHGDWDEIVSEMMRELRPFEDALAHQMYLDFQIETRANPVEPHTLLAASRQAAQQIFNEQMPAVLAKHAEDIDAMYTMDPAAKSSAMIRTSYPGPKALLYYRIAHEIRNSGAHNIARIITEIAHERWGIDINPGAQIDREAAIDHGTGVVVGETAKMGRRSKLYHNVTIGAAVDVANADKHREPNGPRHPQLVGEDITVYSGAKLYGGNTTVGDRVVIGADATLFESTIGNNAKVGIGTDVQFSSIGDDTKANAHAVISGSQLDSGTYVGSHATIKYVSAGKNVTFGTNSAVVGKKEDILHVSAGAVIDENHGNGHEAA